MIIHWVDAFASAPFKGNPAAVVRLEEWLPDEMLQAIAAENNLSETAFYIPGDPIYKLRWFTPEVEVDLCGHATIAAAKVILGIETIDCVVFETRSGELTVSKEDDLYILDFPSRPPEKCTPHPLLIKGLGAKPREILAARDYLCVFDTEEEVRALTPDMEALKGIDRFATIVTAPGRDCDFVSRFFAPAKGVPEDPVTGSAHTTLIPYWSKFLGKKKMFARQVSKRGGELWCEDAGDRVKIGGEAQVYLEGALTIPLD